jgi:hypothetical protein
MSDKECEEHSSSRSLDKIKAQCGALKSFWMCHIQTCSSKLRKKLENKGNKCIFVGYSKEIKGYKLYDLIARKIIISLDVHFMENEAWDGSITKTIKIIDAMEHDDTKYEVVQTPCIG